MIHTVFMKALVYHGAGKVSVDTVANPAIQHPADVIIKVTSTAICGSDLHLFGGLVPTVEDGDIFGHEFMGEVVEIGSEVKNIKKGDRILVPFPIGCGQCFFANGVYGHSAIPPTPTMKKLRP